MKAGYRLQPTGYRPQPMRLIGYSLPIMLHQSFPFLLSPVACYLSPVVAPETP